MSNGVFAVPSPYVNTFGPLRVDNQTNSTLLRDNADPNKVWVLPPGAGKTEFAGMVRSANLTFCPGIKDLGQASNAIDKKIGSLGERLVSLEPELAAAEKVLAAARTQLGEAGEKASVAEMMMLDVRVKDLSIHRDEVIAQLDRCTQNCDVLAAEYKKVSGAIETARLALAKVEAENRADARAYRIAKSRVDQAQANFDDVGSRVLKLSENLAKLGKQVFDLYSTKGKLEGGIVKLDYDLNWDKNVLQLTNSNPHYQFEKISTVNARIFANIVAAGDAVSYYESLPMILDYTINGVRYLPWATTDHAATALPSTLVGNMRMSLLGACPIADPHFFDGTMMVTEKSPDGSPLFAISASYQYPSAFKFKVTAKYNLFKFYERIQESGSHGGFFSSSSYTEVTENKIDRDAFSIDWLIEDPNTAFTSELRAQIQAQLKQDLMNRVLSTIAQPGTSATSEPLLLAPCVPPAPGAVVFANGLNATCPQNIYCQGGGWFLRGLTAIFGSAQSTASFRQTWDRTASETWSSDVATLVPGAIAFRR